MQSGIYHAQTRPPAPRLPGTHERIRPVQLRRETRIDNGYKDVIRFDGGGVGVDGNLMGDEFSIVRNNSAIAHINARRALNRTAYGIEIVDDASAPLALGVAFAILMLRDYDRVWVRGAGRVSI